MLTHRIPRPFLVVSLALTLLAVGASAGAGAGQAATKKAAPTVKLLKKPPSSTSSRSAEFRFKVSPSRSRVSCRLDSHPFRRCSVSISYRGLRSSLHTFSLRARDGTRTTNVRHRWRVRATSAPTTGSTQPSGATAPATENAFSPPPAPSPVAAPVDPNAPLFADDFNGTTIDSATWEVYDGPGHDGRGLRRPSAMTLDGQGNLVITAQWQDGQIVSGGMGHRVNYTYGRYVFRARLEPDPTGTMSGNVLTWPRDQWSPEFTENDMWETGWHPNNNYRFNTFIHFGTQNWQHWHVHDVDPSQWHIVEMDWRPERLAIYVDGAFAWETTDAPAIPDIPHHLCLQMDPEANRALAGPVRMFVDWVRIYR